MDLAVILTQLNDVFPSAIKTNYGTYGCETFVVEKDRIRDVVEYLKDKLGFIFLTDLCGVHYPDDQLPFAVVYHLHNLVENQRIRLKVFLESVPKVDTVSDIFLAANWMERETFDFYGIEFQGHPNLIRILNVEYLDYFPMRKEYPLEDPTRDDKDDRFFGR
jgi:NADH-quinone oxidoreductase subunit C